MSADVVSLNQATGEIELKPVGQFDTVTLKTNGIRPHLDRFSLLQGYDTPYDIKEGDRVSAWHDQGAIKAIRIVDLFHVREVGGRAALAKWQRQQEEAEQAAWEKQQQRLDREAEREAMLNRSNQPITVINSDNRRGQFAE